MEITRRRSPGSQGCRSEMARHIRSRSVSAGSHCGLCPVGCGNAGREAVLDWQNEGVRTESGFFNYGNTGLPTAGERELPNMVAGCWSNTGRLIKAWQNTSLVCKSQLEVSMAFWGGVVEYTTSLIKPESLSTMIKFPHKRKVVYTTKQSHNSGQRVCAGEKRKVEPSIDANNIHSKAVVVLIKDVDHLATSMAYPVRAFAPDGERHAPSVCRRHSGAPSEAAPSQPGLTAGYVQWDAAMPAGKRCSTGRMKGSQGFSTTEIPDFQQPGKESYQIWLPVAGQTLGG
eukprot:Gb_27338 [translate_table: standard]